MPRQSPYDQQSLVLLESAKLDHGNYPPVEVTKKLAELTNLSRKQVWDWFNKHRQAALPLDQRRPAMARRAREAKAAAKKETEEDGEETEEEGFVGGVESGGDPDEEEDGEMEGDDEDEDAAETAAAGAKRKGGPISKARPKKLARIEVEDEAEDEGEDLEEDLEVEEEEEME